MNIYDFIISATVREHLKSIGYQPSTLEAAWLVWQCKNATLQQKHDAWREIIATTADCAIPAGDLRGASPSLHRHLEKHMLAEEQLLNRFYDNAAGKAVYAYALCFQKEAWGFFDDECQYSSFEVCWQAALQNSELGIRAVRITRRLLDCETSAMWLDLIPSGEVVAVSAENDEECEENLIDEWFCGLHLPIPVPFACGDVLSPAARTMGPLSSVEDTCVYDCEKEGRAYGYFAGAGGELLREQVIHPLNYELSKVVSDPDQKRLKLLSDYIKGTISLIEFLSAEA